MDKIVVTSYKDLDMDGYASAVCYAELLRSNGLDAVAASVGRVGIETKFVLDFLKIKPIQSISSFDDFYSIILVDSDCIDSTELEANPDKVIEIIDHHVECRIHIYPNAKIQRVLIGACATLIAERLMAADLVITKENAILLYAGIISNTINLKNKITDERDIAAANYLKKIGQVPDNFIEKMFESKSDVSGYKLREELDYDYFERDFFGHIFAISQLEIVGASKLVEDRGEEIKDAIKNLSSASGPEFQFLNIIDILDGYNIIISFNNETEILLSKILNIEFVKSVSKIDHIIMRKEIIAKVKDYFEANK